MARTESKKNKKYEKGKEKELTVTLFPFKRSFFLLLFTKFFTKGQTEIMLMLSINLKEKRKKNRKKNNPRQTCTSYFNHYIFSIRSIPCAAYSTLSIPNFTSYLYIYIYIYRSLSNMPNYFFIDRHTQPVVFPSRNELSRTRNLLKRQDHHQSTSPSLSLFLLSIIIIIQPWRLRDLAVLRC